MKQLTGAAVLARLAVKRDRLLVPAWVAVLVVMAAFSGSAGADLFPTAASRLQAAAGINDSPAFVSLLGRVYDPMSVGALSLIKLTTFGAAMIAVLAIVLVVRHTRKEEESGRLELLGAAVVGRGASLAAALVLVAGTMVLIGVLTAAALAAVGLPVAGACAFGLAWATTGLAFAAVAAVAAQLTVTARAATGLSLAVLAVAYTLRALGDGGGDAHGPAFWSWVSPIGWGQQVRPFAGDRWWVLVLPIVFAACVTALAFRLAVRRDLGAGLLPDRPGPAGAAPSLATPLALAWRLQRGAFAGWVVAYVLLGFVYGNLASSIGTFASSKQFEDYFHKLGGTGSLSDAFFAAEFGILALLTAAYGVSVSLHLRTEEESGRLELLLSRAVPRRQWLAAHVVLAVVATTVLTALAGLASAVANAVQLGSTTGFTGVVAGAFAYLPAVWVFVGLVVACFGLAPRLTVGVWGLLAACLVVGELGALLGLPAWVIDLSPFSHIPKVPGGAMTWGAEAVLLVVAVLLVAAGAWGFRRRDVVTV